MLTRGDLNKFSDDVPDPWSELGVFRQAPVRPDAPALVKPEPDEVVGEKHGGR